MALGQPWSESSPSWALLSPSGFGVSPVRTHSSPGHSQWAQQGPQDGCTATQKPGQGAGGVGHGLQSHSSPPRRTPFWPDMSVLESLLSPPSWTMSLPPQSDGKTEKAKVPNKQGGPADGSPCCSAHSSSEAFPGPWITCPPTGCGSFYRGSFIPVLQCISQVWP